MRIDYYQICEIIALLNRHRTLLLLLHFRCTRTVLRTNNSGKQYDSGNEYDLAERISPYIEIIDRESNSRAAKQTRSSYKLLTRRHSGKSCIIIVHQTVIDLSLSCYTSFQLPAARRVIVYCFFVLFCFVFLQIHI